METQYNQSFGNQSLSAINQHQLEMTQSLTVNQNSSLQYSSLVHMPKHTKSEFINYLIIQENPSQTQAFQKDQATLNQSSVSNFASNNILGPGSQIIQQQNMSSSNQGQNQEKNIQPEHTLMLIGEKGYRTALCSHGFNDGCYYLEVEMLQPQMPLPFINVQPSLRVGFAVYDDQDLELPLGAHSRSYCYSSTGQLVTNSKNIYKQPNDSFCKPTLQFYLLLGQGDVIGAFIYLKPPKPKFLQQNPNDQGMEIYCSQSQFIINITKNFSFHFQIKFSFFNEVVLGEVLAIQEILVMKRTQIIPKKSFFLNTILHCERTPKITVFHKQTLEQQKCQLQNPQVLPLPEISHGSYIEFFKNGVKQSQNFIDIYEGTYYAGVSLYMQAQCKINFGEQPFKYPPSQTETKSTLERWLPYKEVLKNQRGISLPQQKQVY